MNTSVGKIMRIALLSVLCVGLMTQVVFAGPQKQNVPVKAGTHRLLPDLQVTDAMLQGNRFLVLTVANVGKGRIPARSYRTNAVFACRIQVNGKVLGTVDLSRLDPGKRLVVPGGRVTYRYDLKTQGIIKTGIKNVKIIANWQNRLREAPGAERNNLFVKNFNRDKVVRKNVPANHMDKPPALGNTKTMHRPQVSSNIAEAGKLQLTSPPSYPMKVSLVNPRWNTTDNLMIIIAFNLEPRVSTLSKPGAIEVRQVEGTRKGNPLPGRIVMTDGKSLKWYSNVAGWLCSKDRVCRVEVTISDIVTDKWGRMLDGDSSGRPGGNYVKTLTVNTGGVMGPPNLSVCLTSGLNAIGAPGGWLNDIYFKIRNRSTKTSPPAQIRIKVDGKKTTTQMVPSIPAEGTVYVKRTVTFYRGGKTLSYSAQIDPGNLIEEGNENDNYVSGKIYTHGVSYLKQHRSYFTEQALKNHINTCS